MNFTDIAWDTEIEDVIMHLRQADIQDPAYWQQTVEIVEAGYDPTTRKPITVEGLETWVARCKSPPPQEEEATVDASSPRKSRHIHPSNQPVQDQ